MAENEEMVTMVSSAANSDADWPVVGPEVAALRQTEAMLRLGADAANVVEEARNVLRHCGRPLPVRSQDVGLVMGYVQSGKTFNFTTVCALARDNGYPIVIVIAGISTPLLNQSSRRLERDLRLLTRADRRWFPVVINTQQPSPAGRINDVLEDWRSSAVPDERRRAVLITVMKQHRNLQYLVTALRGLDLSGLPALIIDDEGDQASLNHLINRGRESTNYRHINSLRALLPTHRYLQYTATPQAPLLINLIDVLSPSFVEVLRPGTGYTGGTTFFSPEGLQTYIRSIPTSEIFAQGQVLSSPPDTYRLALATFWIGVAAGNLITHGTGNRSMMVHPHQTTNLHQNYYVWATSLKAEWASLIAGPSGESRTELYSLFRSAYDDLSSSVQDIPDWGLILAELPLSIRQTTIWEMNAGGPGRAHVQTPVIEWNTAGYAHILVGGQAMDRGFTVEGLTVTYMPRGMGEANADTVQQRARFFGYKRSYLGYCRVWLESDVRDAFRDYVDHEEDMRTRLEEHARSGRPLREWKRAFFLTLALKPTRQQVISVTRRYERGNDAARWVDPSRPHLLTTLIEANNTLIDDFLGTLALEDDDGDSRRTQFQRHRVAHGVRLDRVFAELLGEVRLPDPADSNQHIALLLQVERYLERNPDATCSVFHMRPGVVGQSERKRERDDSLGNFYQGANPPRAPNVGEIYPGDREIRAPNDLTIQIHTFRLTPDPQGDDQTIYPRVSFVATYVPADAGADWLVQ